MYRQGMGSIQIVLEGFGFSLGPQEILRPFLDLSHALTTQPQHVPDFLQRLGFIIEPKTQAENLLLTWGNLVEKLVDLFREG
jgi:hypothetical protein